MRKEKNEIANNNKKVMDLDCLRMINNNFINGNDTITDDDCFSNGITIPGLINHETARLGGLLKPFRIIQEESTPTFEAYFGDVIQAINAVNNSSKIFDISIFVYTNMHKYYEILIAKLVSVMNIHNIKYSVDDMMAYLENSTGICTTLLAAVFNSKSLENIEHMLQFYAASDESANIEDPNKVTAYIVSLLESITAPYIHEATIRITMYLYDYAAYILYYSTLNTTMIDNALTFDISDLMDEMIDEFMFIHDDFQKVLFYNVCNWVMTKTSQDTIIPEIKTDKEE